MNLGKAAESKMCDKNYETKYLTAVERLNTESYENKTPFENALRQWR